MENGERTLGEQEEDARSKAKATVATNLNTDLTRLNFVYDSNMEVLKKDLDVYYLDKMRDKAKDSALRQEAEVDKATHKIQEEQIVEMECLKGRVK